MEEEPIDLFDISSQPVPGSQAEDAGWDDASDGGGASSDSDGEPRRRKKPTKRKAPPVQRRQPAPPREPPVLIQDSDDENKAGDDDDDYDDGVLEQLLQPASKRSKTDSVLEQLLSIDLPALPEAANGVGKGRGKGGRGGRGARRRGRGRGQGRGRGRSRSKTPQQDEEQADGGAAAAALAPAIVIDDCHEILNESKQLEARLQAALLGQAEDGLEPSPGPDLRAGSSRRLAFDPAAFIDLAGDDDSDDGGAAEAVVAQAQAAAVAAAPGDAAAAGPKVVLRFRLPGDKQELKLKVSKSAPLKDAMERFSIEAAKHNWVEAGAKLRFEFDGDRLEGGEAPDDRDMEDDDLVDVRPC